MHAVIETGGKQYRVQVGDVVEVERTGAGSGEKVSFEHVLMVGDGAEAKVGNPTVPGATVEGTVVALDRAKKVVIYTFKHRQNSNRKRRGHRQDFVAVKIDAIRA